MSKTSGMLGYAVRVVFLVLMAFIVLVSPVLFLVFFVPIIGWMVWRLSDRNAELERRVALLENPAGKKPEGS